MKAILVTFLLLISFESRSKVLVISDIDDTVRTTNSEGKVTKLFHFIKGGIFDSTLDIFYDIKATVESRSESVDFIYVTAAPEIIYTASNWLKKKNFPVNEVFMRPSLTMDSFAFKYTTISRVIEMYRKKATDEGEDLVVFFFGDNSDSDHNVYAQIKRDMNVDGAIFIRDVALWGTSLGVEDLEVKEMSGVEFFLSEVDLFEGTLKEYVSASSRAKAINKLENEVLIPRYIKSNLKSKISKARKCWFQDTLVKTVRCRRQAKADAKEAISRYRTDRL